MFAVAVLLPYLHDIICLSVVFIVAYAILLAIYNLFFSPLSAIPGPWYAAISDTWLTIHVVRLEQCKVIHQLFEKYGPVVRVGPNKVVFNDLSTTRNVYSIHKFDKSDYYKSLLTNENDHAMTTLEHTPHSMRRKGYAPHYNPGNLARFQPEMHEPTLELISYLETLGGKNALECLALFRNLMVDVIVSTSFGYRIGAVNKWTFGNTEDPLSIAINDFPKRGILRSVVPSWAWKFICKIPNVHLRRICDSDKIMASFVSERVNQARTQMTAGKFDEAEKVPMLHRLLQYRYSSTSQLMPESDIISECMGHLIAGSDTTSTSLAYFLWELSRRPDISKKLQEELDDAMFDPKAIPDISVLQSLPYLNAFIKEGLRVYSAVPSPLERVVNSSFKTGAANESFDLMGLEIPPGTIIATQAWSMHRNPEVFPSPDVFDPDRWLSSEEIDSEERLARMSQCLMPFGTGSRICGGQNVAQMMMKIVIAAVVRNFEVTAASETDEKSMEIKDSFVIFPSAMECKLHFTPRK
ncbi:cytochrome P450 [Dendrothele bispora CBS 962.96]|uniref:Cytochrome P450 n=1 Tax=Dendrothele bispora (strain CBS 962.96) TaxID=1314807 RepID=A0A4S8M4V2_DENBC|nr:cytochrome P450 [Dendrothele bispora CBS 962.96]